MKSYFQIRLLTLESFIIQYPADVNGVIFLFVLLLFYRHVSYLELGLNQLPLISQSLDAVQALHHHVTCQCGRRAVVLGGNSVDLVHNTCCSL